VIALCQITSRLSPRRRKDDSNQEAAKTFRCFVLGSDACGALEAEVAGEDAGTSEKWLRAGQVRSFPIARLDSS